MEDKKIAEVFKLLQAAELNIIAAKGILAATQKVAEEVRVAPLERVGGADLEDEGKVVEGYFDGEQMIGLDEKRYPVAPNYASKSKLVTGDMLKLTITDDGTFVYKQIGPIERKKVVGILSQNGKDYNVVANGKSYRVLLASVTYFKATPGDEVTIVIPAEGECEWAAIENVIGSAL